MYVIYLVEDEDRLRKILVMYLEKEGYLVRAFSNAEDAMKYMNNHIDLWILDIGLPGADGFELISEIKKENEDVPVIFTSARDSEMDRIMGLKYGSDDYLTKPFSVQELIIRIDKLLRRVYKRENKAEIVWGPYVINEDKRIVSEGEEEIKLTSKEFDLALFFIKNRKKAFSREDILTRVWKDFYECSDRVVDDTVRRMRKKLPKIRLETMYGYGYRLL
ncbi:response regulator transcription factor [Clostridium sp. DL1XJH146]